MFDSMTVINNCLRFMNEQWGVLEQKSGEKAHTALLVCAFCVVHFDRLRATSRSYSFRFSRSLRTPLFFCSFSQASIKIWKENVLNHQNELIPFLVQNVRRDRNGEMVDCGLLKSVVDSIGLTFLSPFFPFFAAIFSISLFISIFFPSHFFHIFFLHSSAFIFQR